jgi:hypothetical protein
VKAAPADAEVPAVVDRVVSKAAEDPGPAAEPTRIPVAPTRASSTDPTPTLTTAIGDIESSTPGRTRVRVKPELRTPEAMAAIEAQLSEHDDVSDVSVNARTGSIVISHDRSRHGSAIIHDVVKDTELVGSTVLDLPEDGGEYGQMDQRLADMAFQVREWIYDKTGIRTGGVFLPAVVAGVGIAQIAIVGITIEMLPGPVLLYIAYDIYRKGRKEGPLVRHHAAAPMPSPA